MSHGQPRPRQRALNLLQLPCASSIIFAQLVSFIVLVFAVILLVQLHPITCEESTKTPSQQQTTTSSPAATVGATAATAAAVTTTPQPASVSTGTPKSNNENNNTTQTPISVQSTSSKKLPTDTTNIQLQLATNNATNSSTISTPRTIDVEQAKKIVRQNISLSPDSHRLLINRSNYNSMPLQDYAPESIEARCAEATGQFGLDLMRNGANLNDNVIISPVSMQILMNLVLLGTDDNSTSQRELSRVLGYDSTSLFSPSSVESQNNSSNHGISVGKRLTPHEAMRNVLESIAQATHLASTTTTTTTTTSETGGLLNTNAQAIGTPAVPSASATEGPGQQQATDQGQLAAHLQMAGPRNDNAVPLSGQVNFTLANLMLTNKQLVVLRAEYEQELKTYYNVQMEQFSRDDKTANTSELPLHERVNKWVQNKTQNQIQELARASDLEGNDLLLVLLNAAHFKGRWLHTFKPRASREQSFYNHGQDSEIKDVMFMRQKAVFGYAEFGSPAQGPYGSSSLAGPSLDSKTSAVDGTETLLTEDARAVGATSLSSPGELAGIGSGNQYIRDFLPAMEMSREETRRLELTSKLDCCALMLPFSLNDGQELSMVILLPNKRNGLSELQANLSSATLNEIYKSMSEQQVQVEMPKFSFESSIDAKQALLSMGLRSIFSDDSAKLNKMFAPGASVASKVGAKVDKVIHKAKIVVDESGAEAAAASMVTITLRNMLRPPTPTFVVDRPFLFIIRHSRSNMPLFMGRVTNL